MVSNIGIDFETLSKSIVQALEKDGKSKPVCFSERANSDVLSPFCNTFYRVYQEHLGNNNVPLPRHVIQSVNVSYPGAMENEFMRIMRFLNRESYEPDSYITFSEYVFAIINNVSRKSKSFSLTCVTD